MECIRNPKHIKLKIPHSFAFFEGTDMCELKKREIANSDLRQCVIDLLDKLKTQNGEQEIIIEAPGNTVSVKLKDVLVYEGMSGEIVIDGE